MQKHAIYKNMPMLEGEYVDPVPVELPPGEIEFLHYHDCVEIGICLQGQALFAIEERFDQFAPGDAVIVAPGVRHYSRAFGDGCRSRFAYLDPMRFTTDFLQRERVAEALRGVASCVLRGEDTQTIYRMFRCFDAGERELAAVLLAELALSLPAASPANPARDAAIADAAAYMKLHYAEPLRIAALASMAHLSESRFRARFAAEYGVTPHAYLARIRADVGAELLRRTDMSVAEIAAEAGFADTSEFFRCFRNIHGTAPTKYRQAATASTDRTSADASGTQTASCP